MQLANPVTFGPCMDRETFEREAAFVAEQNEALPDLVPLSIGGEKFVTVPCRTPRDAAIRCWP